MLNAIENLKKYLLGRDWTCEGSVKNTIRFNPPDNYKFSTAYYIDVPSDLSNTVRMMLFRNAINNIAEIYEVNVVDLLHVVERDTAIMSFQFRSDDPLISNLRYPKFNIFHKHMTHLLSDSAVFSITGEYQFHRNKKVLEAQKYLNECSFLQTEVGSYIIRVELPIETYLIENDWEKGSMQAKYVNRVLIDSFKLATDITHIDPSPENAYSELIDENKGLLCKNVLDDIKGMYFETDNAPMAIRYNDVSMDRNITLDNSIANNIQRIDVFNREVHDRHDKEIDVEVDIPNGAIIALKSKDPDSNANTILITGYNSNIGTMQHVKLYLDSGKYKEACDAHAHKLSVCITGTGRQSINQISLKHPDHFSINR